MDDFHLFEGRGRSQDPCITALGICIEWILSSLSALARASCRLELSRLLNSVVGLQAAR